MQNATQYLNDLLAAIDARASYETTKNSENTSMQSCIASIRKSVNHAAIAETLMLSNHSVETINRAERSNNRFNVYAFEKIVNVARMLNAVASLNHYTLAIVKAAHAFESAELTLTHKDAVSACSLDCKHSDKSREKILKDVRYAKHVHASTASTQSSSSINALQALNVLRETRDESNNVVYSLNRESFATQALAAKLSLAL